MHSNHLLFDITIQSLHPQVEDFYILTTYYYNYTLKYELRQLTISLKTIKINFIIITKLMMVTINTEQQQH